LLFAIVTEVQNRVAVASSCSFTFNGKVGACCIGLRCAAVIFVDSRIESNRIKSDGLISMLLLAVVKIVTQASK
jgi:hypothetical protein